jgi:hypothetical protein
MEDEFDDDDYCEEEGEEKEDDEEEEDVEIPEGMFKEDLEQIKENNKREERIIAENEGTGYISSAEAEYHRQHFIKDLPEIVEKAQELEEYLIEHEQDIASRIESGQLSEFGGEIEMFKLDQKRRKFEKRLHLNSAGLEPEDLYDVIDDSVHLLDDSATPEIHEIRKDIIEDLKKIPFRERKIILEELYANGEISAKQYSNLYNEFLR